MLYAYGSVLSDYNKYDVAMDTFILNADTLITKFGGGNEMDFNGGMYFPQLPEESKQHCHRKMTPCRRCSNGVSCDVITTTSVFFGIVDPVFNKTKLFTCCYIVKADRLAVPDFFFRFKFVRCFFFATDDDGLMKDNKPSGFFVLVVDVVRQCDEGKIISNVVEANSR